MSISVFDLFKIGIGPSSSHTVGPMRAAYRFVNKLIGLEKLNPVSRLEITLYGSLGATGVGHGTDKAILMGLSGEKPDEIDPQTIESALQSIKSSHRLNLFGQHPVTFDYDRDLLFNGMEALPYHANGMQFKALDAAAQMVDQHVYYSVGGGFVVDEADAEADRLSEDDEVTLAYPFHSMAELLAHCETEQQPISRIMMENEKAWRSEDAIREGLLNIWQVMQDCIQTGCEHEGILPGGLMVARRAPDMYRKLREQHEAAIIDPLSAMDWVNLYAIAVNEENAGGGRVVTAPTNGAAGIVPAVLKYYDRFSARSDDEGIVRFLLTAAAIGILFKENASISGAEVGCQGEVGSACSMAAAGLTEVMGGTPAQVENAAEIAMEHNLGLTCDPINGLVQVPCIERNAMAAVKAINAKRMALSGDGTHFVSLDKVIKTMRDTGRDMQSKYKETARGGLAVNVIEC